MKKILLAISIAWSFSFSIAAAQDQTRTVERTFASPANKDARIGVYLNVRTDCSSGPLPTIRLASPPASGKVVVKSAQVKATNYKACLALEVPAYVAFYRSMPDFSGADNMVIEVRYPDGRTETQKITVNVGASGAQQKI